MDTLKPALFPNGESCEPDARIREVVARCHTKFATTGRRVRSSPIGVHCETPALILSAVIRAAHFVVRNALVRMRLLIKGKRAPREPARLINDGFVKRSCKRFGAPIRVYALLGEARTVVGAPVARCNCRHLIQSSEKSRIASKTLIYADRCKRQSANDSAARLMKRPPLRLRSADAFTGHKNQSAVECRSGRVQVRQSAGLTECRRRLGM